MTTAPSLQALVLAAGLGTRMRSEKIKVLHEILGVPLIGHVIAEALKSGAHRVIPILGHQRERVEDYFRSQPWAQNIDVAYQEEQLGTAHAVYSAQNFFDDSFEYTAILSGDVPNMDAPRLRAFFQATIDSGAAVGLVTAQLDDPLTYGRILRDGDQVRAIVEHADASKEERAIQEINAGIYLVKTPFLRGALEEIMTSNAENAQKEYYLTDLIALAARGPGVFGWVIDEPQCIQGVNNRVQLSMATDFARRRINEEWMLQGVTLLQPDQVLIDANVIIEEDVTLYPGVHLAGQTVIRSGSIIEAGVQIRDSQIGPSAQIKAYSYLTDAMVGAESSIGPFAHLRPGSEIGPQCKIGNFVEVKKTRLHQGAKASHLTYLGDAEVGPFANVGAGTITCNYDGHKKSTTTIGAHAFIGSNSALVAPVRIGEGAYVGAGSVITEDVPDKALGVARGRQRNIAGWGDSQAKNEE